MFKDKKAAFYTLGCKLNFSETSTISRQLSRIGFIKTSFDDQADLYVINTCSVTENANRECRRIIRKAKRNSPNSFIIVTGCFAQLKPKEITTLSKLHQLHVKCLDQWHCQKHLWNRRKINNFHVARITKPKVDQSRPRVPQR